MRAVGLKSTPLHAFLEKRPGGVEVDMLPPIVLGLRLDYYYRAVVGFPPKS